MKNIIIVVLVFFLAGCRETYDLPTGALQIPLLVVEANLDPGAGATNVRLSRTTRLGDPTLIRVENNAVVTVEGKDNSLRTLNFTGNGNYFSANLSLILNNEYRLRIKSSGKEYLSDYVKAISNPPLDSISWDRNSDGVQLYLNTNDPANTTKYFRWDYTETWEIHSYFVSTHIFQNGSLRQRNFPAEDVSVCWKNSPSTRILLANSVQLQSGLISKAPVVFIKTGDEKLFFRYSIIAKQYALSKEAYNFFEILKRNSEDIGSFFGPLPSELKGNIQNVNQPNETVIGYVTASAVTEKRIFISRAQVPNWPSFVFCDETRITNNSDSIKNAVISGLVPAYFLGSPPNQYVFSSPFCVDCTTRGATNIKPVFW